MNARAVAIFMKDNGFTIRQERGGKTFWTDGITQIVTFPNGTQGDLRTEQNLRAAVKRAMALRPMKPGQKAAAQPSSFPMGEKKIIRPPESPKLTAPLGIMAQMPNTQPVQKLAKRARGKQPWDETELEILLIRLKELFDEGYSQEEMVGILTKEKFRNAQGDPLNRGTISQMLLRNGLRRYKPLSQRRKEAAMMNRHNTPPPPTTLPIPRELPVEKKPYVPPFNFGPPPTQAPSPKQPPPAEQSAMATVVEILRDNKISPEKRIKIALAYLE